jgi:hypothetical protein
VLHIRERRFLCDGATGGEQNGQDHQAQVRNSNLRERQ